MSHPLTTSGSDTGSGRNEEIDAVAGQLLALGWVVRRPSPCDGQDPTCLLVSREAFSPAPDTVHVLAHHQLELTRANGPVDYVDDVRDLHRHLNARVPVTPRPHPCNTLQTQQGHQQEAS
jgi:hypothetical protein